MVWVVVLTGVLVLLQRDIIICTRPLIFHPGGITGFTWSFYMLCINLLNIAMFLLSKLQFPMLFFLIFPLNRNRVFFLSFQSCWNQWKQLPFLEAAKLCYMLVLLKLQNILSGRFWTLFFCKAIVLFGTWKFIAMMTLRILFRFSLSQLNVC